jgi:hypothetical protein
MSATACAGRLALAACTRFTDLRCARAGVRRATLLACEIGTTLLFIRPPGRRRSNGRCEKHLPNLVQIPLGGATLFKEYPPAVLPSCGGGHGEICQQRKELRQGSGKESPKESPREWERE